MDTVRLALAGSGSIARTHADALRQVPGARFEIVYSRSLANAELFAQWKGVPAATDDLERLVASDVDAVLVCLPNCLHAEVGIAALRAGKHAIVEKPLAMSLEEADALAEAEAAGGKRVFYAEELPFVPKFVRVKELIDEGALGRVYMVRQVEKHAGPHSPWFFRRQDAGGGALMDMGCHGIELIRWVLGGATPADVFARIDRFVHADCDLDDHAIVDMRFPDGTLGISESSWTLQGGMDSVLEVYGTKGTAVADLCKGTGLRVFSGEGYGMMPDEAKGWTTPIFDHDRQHGYVAQLAHIVDCIRSGGSPFEGSSQGRTVLSILLAAYESARTGRAVAMPFEPRGVAAPIDLWKLKYE